MGYYTKFSMQADPKIDNLKGLVGCNEDIPYGYVVDETWFAGDTHKWYEHEEDMKQFSKSYPSVTFALRGLGENGGDEWIKFFKNGRFYKREINPNYFNFYDESKLK